MLPKEWNGTEGNKGGRRAEKTQPARMTQRVGTAQDENGAKREWGRAGMTQTGERRREDGRLCREVSDCQPPAFRPLSRFKAAVIS